MRHEKEEIYNIAAYEVDKYMKEWGEDVLLIDVREEAKYKQAHIFNAINIPSRDILEKRVDIPKDKILVVYCDRGGLSMTVARYLQKEGYQVVNLIGGLKNYRKKN